MLRDLQKHKIMLQLFLIAHDNKSLLGKVLNKSIKCKFANFRTFCSFDRSDSIRVWVLLQLVDPHQREGGSVGQVVLAACWTMGGALGMSQGFHFCPPKPSLNVKGWTTNPDGQRSGGFLFAGG